MAIVLLISDETMLSYIGALCIVLAIATLLKLFAIPYHIIISNNRVKVFDFPLLATNKFYHKKRSLILWNGEIDICEVEKAELVQLTKDEKIKWVGYNHLFDEYMKVTLKNSKSFKYIYVSMYSSSQIEKLISIFNKKV